MSDLELPPGYQKLLDLIDESPAPGRFAALSAVHHLRKAWRLRDVDHEMAIFRAMTAEEEAATAIMHALRRRRYPGADRLSFKSHRDKQSLLPFITGLSGILSEMPGAAFGVEFVTHRETKHERLVTSMLIEIDGETHKLFPEPPLDYELEANDLDAMLSEHLDAFAKSLGVSRLLKHVEERANKRNELLYASQKGIPVVADDVSRFVLRLRDDVFALLAVFMLIDPYPQHQKFVLQCVPRLLDMLAKMPSAGSYSTGANE